MITGLKPCATPGQAAYTEEETAETAKTAEKHILGDLSVLGGFFLSLCSVIT
jgi:hypothetical protein